MAENNSNLVARVWNYAHVLRRQGVPFGDYIEQITYLLFLKMDEEREELLGEASSIPDRYRWHCLRGLDGEDLERRYRQALEELGRQKGLVKSEICWEFWRLGYPLSGPCRGRRRPRSRDRARA